MDCEADVEHVMILGDACETSVDGNDDEDSVDLSTGGGGSGGSGYGPMHSDVLVIDKDVMISHVEDCCSWALRETSSRSDTSMISSLYVPPPMGCLVL